MQLPVPEAPDPPSLGQLIVWLFYGAGIAVAAIITRFGFLQGKRSEEPGTDRAEIAGAVISDKKANEIIAAIDKQTAATDRNTEALDRSNDQAVELRDAITDMRVELARSGPHRR